MSVLYIPTCYKLFIACDIVNPHQLVISFLLCLNLIKMCLIKPCIILFYVFFKFTQMLINYRYPFATCFCIPPHIFEIHTNFWGRREGRREKDKALTLFGVCISLRWGWREEDCSFAGHPTPYDCHLLPTPFAALWAQG